MRKKKERREGKRRAVNVHRDTDTGTDIIRVGRFQIHEKVCMVGRMRLVMSTTRKHISCVGRSWSNICIEILKNVITIINIYTTSAHAPQYKSPPCEPRSKVKKASSKESIISYYNISTQYDTSSPQTLSERMSF